MGSGSGRVKGLPGIGASEGGGWEPGPRWATSKRSLLWGRLAQPPGRPPRRLLGRIHLLLPDLLPAPPHLACLPAKPGQWERGAQNPDGRQQQTPASLEDHPAPPSPATRPAARRSSPEWPRPPGTLRGRAGIPTGGGPCPHWSVDEAWNPEGLAQVGQADNSGGIIGRAGWVPVPLRHKLLSGRACGLWCLAGVTCNYLNGAGGRCGMYGPGAALLCPVPARGSQVAFRNPTEACFPHPAAHLAVLLSTVSLGFCPPQPYREPEPSVAEPPSCPLVLDMSLRDSSYSVAPAPCVVAQLPSDDMSRLGDPQSRDHGFLRTKMKVLTPTLFPRARSVSVDWRPAHETWHK